MCARLTRGGNWCLSITHQDVIIVRMPRVSARIHVFDGVVGVDPLEHRPLNASSESVLAARFTPVIPAAMSLTISAETIPLMA